MSNSVLFENMFTGSKGCIQGTCVNNTRLVLPQGFYCPGTLPTSPPPTSPSTPYPTTSPPSTPPPTPPATLPTGSVHTAITQDNIKAAVLLWVTNRADALAKYGHISGWNTSAVTDMRALFWDYYGSLFKDFNDDISGWDTSHVTNMFYMFNGASSFNQNIGRWNTSQLAIAYWMFADASSFNQDISGMWDTSQLRAAYYMFGGASFFQPKAMLEFGKARYILLRWRQWLLFFCLCREYV